MLPVSRASASWLPRALPAGESGCHSFFSERHSPTKRSRRCSPRSPHHSGCWCGLRWETRAPFYGTPCGRAGMPVARRGGHLARGPVNLLPGGAAALLVAACAVPSFAQQGHAPTFGSGSTSSSLRRYPPLRNESASSRCRAASGSTWHHAMHRDRRRQHEVRTLVRCSVSWPAALSGGARGTKPAHTRSME